MGEAGTWSKGKFIRAIQTYKRTLFWVLRGAKVFFCGSTYSPTSGESLIQNRIIRVGIETGFSLLRIQIKVYIPKCIMCNICQTSAGGGCNGKYLQK